MKHAFAWLAPLCLAVFSTTQMKADDMTDQNQAILDAITGMTEAFQVSDIPRVMESYVPGAVVAFTPGEAVSDPTQLTTMFIEMAAINPEFTYSGHEVFISGDTGLHIAPWTMVATLPDGSEMTQSGLSVAVLRKQEDGTWRMVIDNPHGARLIATE